MLFIRENESSIEMYVTRICCCCRPQVLQPSPVNSLKFQCEPLLGWQFWHCKLKYLWENSLRLSHVQFLKQTPAERTKQKQLASFELHCTTCYKSSYHHRFLCMCNHSDISKTSKLTAGLTMIPSSIIVS